MDKKKRVGVGVFFVLGSIFIVSMVSAFWPFDRDVELAPFNATVTLQDSPPVITYVFVSSIDVSMTPGVPTFIDVNFTASDNNGGATLDPNSGAVVVTGPEPANAPRTNLSCSQVVVAGNNANYTCLVRLEFYDVNATNLWNVNATVADLGGQYTSNLTYNFSVGKSIEILALNTTLNWTGIGTALTDTNQTADFPMVVRHLGNYYINDVTLNASQLNSTTSSAVIPTFNFSGSANTGASNPECDSSGVTANAFVQDLDAQLIGTNLPVATDAGNSTESFYFCIYPTLNPLGLPAELYTTGVAGTRAWIMTANNL